MDELRPNLHLPSQNAASRRNTRAESRPNRLGQTLRDARKDKGLELRDLAVLTNIRVMHLEALEAGHFSNLPEDPYSKNFVRLYAQAVGLEPSRMLLLYGQERRAAAAGNQGPERALGLPQQAAPSPLDNPRLSRLLRLLATLLLVVVLVLLALWGFNRLLSGGQAEGVRPVDETASSTTVNPVPSTPQTAPNAPASTTTPTTDAKATPTPSMVLLSIRTTPPGAEVSIDGYPFGKSPVTDAPIRTGERTVRIERAGYQTLTSTLELTSNRRLNFELNPTSGVATAANSATPIPTDSLITLNVSEEAWLEVYRGSARGEGERLLYETAQPGDSFTFDAPVYIFSGNASGVSVSQNGQRESLGEGVGGRAYGAQ